MKSSRVLCNANISNVSTRSRSRLQSTDQQNLTLKATNKSKDLRIDQNAKPVVDTITSKLPHQKRNKLIAKIAGNENKENVNEQTFLGSKERKRVIESPQAKVPPNKKPSLSSEKNDEERAIEVRATGNKRVAASSRLSTRSSSRLQELANREISSTNTSICEEVNEVTMSEQIPQEQSNSVTNEDELPHKGKSTSLSRAELMKRLDEVLIKKETTEDGAEKQKGSIETVGVAIKLEESQSLKLEDLSSQSSQDSEAVFSRGSSDEEESYISRKELLPCPKNALVLDYDKHNILQPLLNPVYIRDVFIFLRSREIYFTFSDYLPKQPYITAKMRTIVTDWLFQVQEPLLVQHETIHLAIKICDHYLMRKQILKSSFQLLAITSLFIACKFDERTHCCVEDFLNLCDNAYKKEEMIKLELDILRRLKFDIGFPLAYRFLRRYSNVQNNSFTVLSQARFILECSLLEYSFCSVSDSLLAASCLMLAHLMLDSGTWCPQVELASGFKRKDLLNTMKRLNDNAKQVKSMYWRQQKFFVFRKYCEPVFKRVALNSLVDSEDIC